VKEYISQSLFNWWNWSKLYGNRTQSNQLWINQEKVGKLKWI